MIIHIAIRCIFNFVRNKFRSLSYKTFLADIVIIYGVILKLEKLASIAIVMYENKIELLSKQKNHNCL